MVNDKLALAEEYAPEAREPGGFVRDAAARMGKPDFDRSTSEAVMVRTPEGQEQHPPRDERNRELGREDEQRDRHLRYAHEQYTASGQGRFGAPRGEALPSDRPHENAEKYPRGARMPWPADGRLDSEVSNEPEKAVPDKPVGS